MEAFREYDRTRIENQCIVGDVQMDEVSVDQEPEDAESSIVDSERKIILTKRDSSGTIRFWMRASRRLVQ